MTLEDQWLEIMNQRSITRSALVGVNFYTFYESSKPDGVWCVSLPEGQTVPLVTFSDRLAERYVNDVKNHRNIRLAIRETGAIEFLEQLKILGLGCVAYIKSIDINEGIKYGRWPTGDF
jgi:hypothetical protein